MRRLEKNTWPNGFPLDGIIYNDSGDIIYTVVFEYNSSTILVKAFDFDVFGNLISTEDELGGTITSSYDAHGNLVAQSGTASYPSQLEHDTLGRMKTLHTKRSDDIWDATRWDRDFATGLTTTKTYADGLTIFYTYTPV